jgi:outer membrane lipoprotein-sorting protein
MDRRTFIAAGLAAALTPALAEAQALPASLSRKERDQVKRATAYLQGLGLARGRFVQTTSKGGTSRGTLYLNRPGKARFEYDPPEQLLVVADGKSVWVSDRRLKTAPDRYPLGATPLGIFLAKRVSLDASVVVTRLQQTSTGFAITVRNANGSAGALVLDFADDPIGLRGWTVIDAQRNQTQVQLSGLETVASLSPSLFSAPV